MCEFRANIFNNL